MEHRGRPDSRKSTGHIPTSSINIYTFADRCKKPNTQTGSHSIGLVIVVPHKWVEGPKLHPSDTQLLGGVASKATDVGTHQRYPEHAEPQHRCGGMYEGEVHVYG